MSPPSRPSSPTIATVNTGTAIVRARAVASAGGTTLPVSAPSDSSTTAAGSAGVVDPLGLDEIERLGEAVTDHRAPAGRQSVDGVGGRGSRLARIGHGLRPAGERHDPDAEPGRHLVEERRGGRLGRREAVGLHVGGEHRVAHVDREHDGRGRLGAVQADLGEQQHQAGRGAEQQGVGSSLPERAREVDRQRCAAVPAAQPLPSHHDAHEGDDRDHGPQAEPGREQQLRPHAWCIGATRTVLKSSGGRLRRMTIPEHLANRDIDPSRGDRAVGPAGSGAGRDRGRRHRRAARSRTTSRGRVRATSCSSSAAGSRTARPGTRPGSSPRCGARTRSPSSAASTPRPTSGCRGRPGVETGLRRVGSLTVARTEAPDAGDRLRGRPRPRRRRARRGARAVVGEGPVALGRRRRPGGRRAVPRRRHGQPRRRRAGVREGRGRPRAPGTCPRPRCAASRSVPRAG